MVRYDKSEEVVIVEVEKDNKNLKKILIDQNHMIIIKNIFISKLKNMKIDNNLIIKNVTKEHIVFDPRITVEMLSNTLDTKVVSKLEFIKNMYMFLLDDIIDEAYDEKVIAIQEFPYSFNHVNENTIKYEFIS